MTGSIYCVTNEMKKSKFLSESDEVGYNPRYHGRRSYKAKVAFVSESCELLNAGLYGGKTSSNGGFLEFLQETLSMVAPQTVVKGVRMDKGFFELQFLFHEQRKMQMRLYL